MILLLSSGIAAQAQDDSGTPPASGSASGVEARVNTILPPVPVSSSAAPVIRSMAEAVAMAYDSNPQLLSSRILTSAADERMVQARAIAGPTLNFSGNYGYARDQFDTPIGNNYQRGWAGTASLILNQPIFQSGRIKAGIQAGEADIELARQALRLSENQMLFDVYSSYVGVLRDRKLVDIAQQNLDLLDRQYSDNDARFKVREITRTDLDQVLTRREFGRAGLENARGQLSISNGEFLNSVGAMPGDLAPAPVPSGMPQTLEDAQVLAERHSPLLLAAHARERISRALVKQAEADIGPSVALQGQASYGAQTAYSDDLNQRLLRAGVSVQMPLYDSGRRYARVREAKLQNESDWRLVERALRDVRTSVERNWDNFISTRNGLGNYRNAVDAAQRAYEGAVIQERAGARTTLDVLDLLRDLLSARSTYASAIATADASRAGLLAAMGTLDIDSLVPTGLPYKPSDHLNRVKGRGDSLFIGPIITGIDGVVSGTNNKGRPYQDPAASIRPTGLPNVDTGATGN